MLETSRKVLSLVSITSLLLEAMFLAIRIIRLFFFSFFVLLLLLILDEYFSFNRTITNRNCILYFYLSLKIERGIDSLVIIVIRLVDEIVPLFFFI